MLAYEDGLHKFVSNFTKFEKAVNQIRITNQRIFCLELEFDRIIHETLSLLKSQRRQYFNKGRIVKSYKKINPFNNKGGVFNEDYKYVMTNFKKLIKFFNKQPMLTKLATNKFNICVASHTNIESKSKLKELNTRQNPVAATPPRANLPSP